MPDLRHVQGPKKKLRVNVLQIGLVTFTLILVLFLTLSSLLWNSRKGITVPAAAHVERGSLTAPPPPGTDGEQKQTSVSKGSSRPKNKFHFVVSSDCTSYQRWETLTQLHSAQNIHQCGRFTWIVSGCLEEGSAHIGKGKGGANSDVLTHALLLEEVERHFPHLTLSNHTIAGDTGLSASSARDNKLSSKQHEEDDCFVLHPHIHFTPDYSDMSLFGGPFADGTKRRYFLNRQGKVQHSNYGNTYKFNNKPNGLHHWALDFLANDQRRDEAIVLIDPDFLFLTKFQFPEGTPIVEPGKPAAAKYGLGGQFLDFNLTRICNSSPYFWDPSTSQPICPFRNITNADVHRYYSAGPPYIIHIQDVLSLSKRWVELVPPTYDEYPLLYAEMFAYSMAAADLGLKHNLIKGLFTGCMVSWPHVHDKKGLKTLKTSAKKYAYLIEHMPSGNEASGGGAASCFQPPLTPPPFLHYCQRYSFVTPYDNEKNSEHTEQQNHDKNELIYHFFAKRRVDHDILECSHDGPLEPFVSNKPEKIAGGEKDWNVLAVCAIVRAINFAKEKGCEKDAMNQ